MPIKHAMHHTDRDYLSHKWNPAVTYTATMPQIKEWFLRLGESGYYNGDLYELKYKRLCPGVYKVWFEKAT